MEHPGKLIDVIRDEVASTPGLRLLVVHGSQARGTARPDSDIDLAYLARPGTDIPGMAADLVHRLGSEAVDVVDLARASALLRLRVAQEGLPVLERPRGAFREFQLEAARFWCDVEPVVRAAHEQVLAALP